MYLMKEQIIPVNVTAFNAKYKTICIFKEIMVNLQNFSEQFVLFFLSGKKMTLNMLVHQNKCHFVWNLLSNEQIHTFLSVP